MRLLLIASGEMTDIPLPKATTSGPPKQDAPSDRSLLLRFREGSQDAATLLYLRYAQRLLALVHAQSSLDLAVREDPEDLVQSVFRSFFEGVNRGYYDIPAGEEL